ncbi:MAG TPA: tetratricopeptide repeat protein [Anaeromyxobacteraceae bacterium]|jgi:tetratricopeptide (TPR) repeat protein|nr:tetratricopeptide repeat protein [Anaeromyxobacteraceae bacterium]
MRARRLSFVPLLAAAALLPALLLASRVVLSDQRRPGAYEVSYVPRGKSLSLLSRPVQLTVANFYWLLAVQYIGDQALRRGACEELYPLVDLITDLDPGHGYAYQTAGIVLSAAGRIGESNRILQKGIERGPDWWTYPYYVAFNHFFYLGDYAGAAEWAERAARTKGASPNISHLALAMRVKSGDPDDAVRLLAGLRDEARDESTRGALEEQYRLALLQRDFARIDRASEAFRAARGRPPESVRELIQAGLLAQLPSAPYGGAYTIGPDGRAHSTVRDFHFKPPERGRLEPPAPAPTPSAAPIEKP